MNTNNKEAMELLKIARGRLTVLHKDTAEMVNLAIEKMSDPADSNADCSNGNCPMCFPERFAQ